MSIKPLVAAGVVWLSIATRLMGVSYKVVLLLKRVIFIIAGRQVHLYQR